MEYTRLQERILLESIVISRYRNTSWDGIRVDFSSDKLPGFFTTPVDGLLLGGSSREWWLMWDSGYHLVMTNIAMENHHF